MKNRSTILRATRVIGIAALAVAVTLGVMQPAQAAPKPTEIAYITVAGHVIDMAAVRAGAPFVVSNGTKFVIKPEAATKLSAHDYAAVTKMVVDANKYFSAAAAVRTNNTSANAAELKNACTNKIRWGHNDSTVALRLPSCLVQNVGVLIAATGTITALIATALASVVAALIAGSIAAGAAVLVAANAVCNIFGDGNGIEISVFYSKSPPNASPPQFTGCW